MVRNYFLPVYIFLILGLTIIIGLKPDYNWDMLPYMAILEKMDGVKPFSQVHTNVYSEAEKKLPKKKYNDLVDTKDKYRKKMAEDSYAFETQLPFFIIKPIYLISSFVFYKIGFSLSYATVLPSLISYFFINIISLLWIRKFSLSFKSQLLILSLICIITIPLAARSNPDALSCLLMLIGSYFFLEHENLFLPVLFLALSILVRPENIIFSFLLYGIVLLGRWKRKIPAYVSLINIGVLALCYYLPQKFMSNPGWSSLFYHAFIENTADPSVKQTITIPVYLKVIKENFLNIKGIPGIILLLGLSIIMLQQKNMQFQNLCQYKLFYIAVIVCMIIKLLLFPMLNFRFIIPSFLLIIFVAVKEYELKFYRKNYLT